MTMFTQYFFVLIYVLVFSCIGCVDEAVKRQIFNIYKGIGVEVKEVTHTEVSLDEITYRYFDNYQPYNGTVFSPSRLDIINSTSDKIFFILHGWTSSATADWVIDMKNAFLISHPDCSVITVDWEKPAGQLYPIAALNTYDVGNFVGDMIIDLVDNYKIEMKKFIAVGHSLGGQACGFVGKKLKKAGKVLLRIVALDPAGPFFSARPKDKRLQPSDAEVVEVLHSDSGRFGISGSFGTIDFFANGGQFQPGCARIDLFDILNIDPVLCDHARSHAYFIEAILNPSDFLAKKCAHYNILVKDCDENINVPLGDLTTTAQGNFYFDTNKEPPYAKRRSSTTGILGIASKLFKQ